jgi:hypothetical protein
MKKALAIAVRVLISGGLLWLLFREHSLTEKILPQLGMMAKEWRWALAGIACAGLGQAFSALRWWIVLRPQVPQATLGLAVEATLGAAFFNITSLGTLGGDAYRVIAVKQKHPGSAAAAGMSILVDHLAGMFGMSLLFFAFGIAALQQWPSFAPRVQSILGGFAVFLVIGSALMVLSVLSLSPGFIAWMRRRCPRIPRWAFLDRMSHTFDPFWQSWRSGLMAVFLSLGVFLSIFSAFYCGLRAVGGSAPLLPVLIAMPIVDMATALPVSVSGLGVREKTFEALMSALVALPHATSISAALAGWLFSIVWGLVGGVLFIFRRPQSMALENAELRTEN